MIRVPERLAEELLRHKQLAALFGILGYYHVLRVTSSIIDSDSGAIAHRISQMASRSALAHLDLHIDVEGRDQLEHLGSYAVVCNHASYLDWALLLGHFPAPLRFIAKRELVSMPVIGAFLKHHGVLIDRKRGKDAKAAIHAAARDGKPWPIAIFPEGTRTYDGQIARFKRGGLQILAEAGLTLLPVCALGTYEAFSRHARSIKIDSRLMLRIEEPVYPARFDTADQAVVEVERRIRAGCAQGMVPPPVPNRVAQQYLGDVG